MDPAVALVDAYLQLNGYFTVVEYPVIGPDREGGYGELTDLDVLAFRFPRAGRWVPARGGGRRRLVPPDPELRIPQANADMIVAEVKEGRAAVNRPARRREVLLAALTRFGCCTEQESPGLVDRLLAHGAATTCEGHSVRMMVFASARGHVPAGWHFVALGHVVAFLTTHVERNWRYYQGVRFRHPALGLLMTVHKALAAEPVARDATAAARARKVERQ